MALTASPPVSPARHRRRVLAALLAVAAGVLAAPLGAAAWRHFHPVSAEEGWSVRVFLEDLPSVSALARDAEGNLFVSLEQKGGRGSIVKIGSQGARDTVIRGLYKPDGMVAWHGGIAYTQEHSERAVRWWRGNQDVPLFDAIDAEGIATDGRTLYVVEDLPVGARLFRYDPGHGKAEVLRDQLEVAEGVAVCPDGALFYSEKKKGTVSRVTADAADPAVSHGLNAPGYLLCDDAGLWVTEDATHGARLLRLPAGGGEPEVVLSHLRSGQTLLRLGSDHYLLAEQGRDRILEISR